MSSDPNGLVPSPEAPRHGLAIASLVLGILAICLSLFLVGGVLGVVGLALGLLHLSKKPARVALAWSGIGLSLASVVLSIALGFVYMRFVNEVRKTMASAQNGGDLARWQGVRAPAIQLTTLEGTPLNTEDLKGKRVVLDFWATWCGPCVREIPHFIQLRKEFPGEQLVIIGISDESPDTLKPFVKKKGINYPIASAKDLPEPFKSIQAIPSTFFIDRKGVIQSIAVGGREYADIKELALAKDYEGEPKPAPPPLTNAAPLRIATNPLQAVAGWSASLPQASAICIGDWNGDGASEILVAGGRRLHVLGLDGVEKTSLPLPGDFANIECGHHRQNGPRLLGYSSWGRTVEVLDQNGQKLWSYPAVFGVDGAHWGDLDGDGTDELIVGMNGSGGLDAISADGKKLWHVPLGNVWGQAVVSATPNRPSMVFATEAGGTVRAYDGLGQAVNTIRPQDAYCTRLAAMPSSVGSAQILALGQKNSGAEVLAFDPTGQVAWSAPAGSSGNWVQLRFAGGDFLGDGGLEWVFPDPAGNLVVASAVGEQVAVIPGAGAASDFVVVPNKSGPALLVILRGGVLQAYSLK